MNYGFLKDKNGNKIYINDNSIYHEGKKLNEVLQNITANEIYSTEEVRIGTWIDGKPLYRKTFSNITIPDSTGSISVTVLDFSSIHNIDNILLDESASFMKANTKPFESLVFNFYGGGNNWSRIFIRKGDKTVRMISGVSLVNYTGTITLLYTKTTD